jgi:hypothetical protein
MLLASAPPARQNHREKRQTDFAKIAGFRTTIWKVNRLRYNPATPRLKSGILTIHGQNSVGFIH